MKDMIVVKVDVDELEEVAASQKIQAMPTFLFFKCGDLFRLRIYKTRIHSRKGKKSDSINKTIPNIKNGQLLGKVEGAIEHAVRAQIAACLKK